MTAHRSFHVVTVGWNLDVIRRLADPLAASTSFRFSHVIDPSLDRRSLRHERRHDIFLFRDDVRTPLPEADRERLAALERQSGVPTIHNMIMADRVVRFLDHEDALRWVSYVSRRLEMLFNELRPSVVIGGFDGVHSGVALAVARKIGVPWFALHFNALPTGLTGFCSQMSPESSVAYRTTPVEELRSLAQRVVDEFETRKLTVPSYVSANSLAMVARRLPRHVRVLLQRLRARSDRYTQYPVSRLVRDYVRKRMNLISLRRQGMLEEPPSTPFVFFGLHMQPESSIDVWAPFFSDQFAVIESIARSTPPTHQLLVKLHKSDADNYSPKQLDRLRRMPGVRLVSPYAQSRAFIDGAALVFAIQGNIALEAALLGRPVLLFGDSHYTQMPSVAKVKRVTDLPGQIRNMLEAPPPSRDAILQGLTAYLGHFAPGCSNDWEQGPSRTEIAALAEHFTALRDFLENNACVA